MSSGTGKNPAVMLHLHRHSRDRALEALVALDRILAGAPQPLLLLVPALRADQGVGLPRASPVNRLHPFASTSPMLVVPTSR